jgi:plasmid stabilization system protein ParE
VKVRWSRRALWDLREIGGFISRDSPQAARRWVGRLQERAKKAAFMPRAGRMVPELNLEQIREVLIGNYRIVYRLKPQEIEILTVFEGHRLFPLTLEEVEDC